MTIFAGETEYTTPRPFETNSARVKLSFTVAEGEDAAVVGINTGSLARRLAEQMLRANPGSMPEVTLTQTPTTRQRRAAVPAEPVGMVTQAIQTAPVGEAAPATIEGTPGAHDPFGAAGATASSQPGSAVVSDTALNNPSQTSAAVITDAMLQDAIVKKNADARNTPMIKELIMRFTNDPVAKIYAVTDQAQRQAFLAALAALGS